MQNIDDSISPLVSIIAICHKHALYVVESLDSFKNQTYKNIQLIIINNVKDECEEIISKWIYKNEFEITPLFIQNKIPKTIVENCNLGLSFCEGKYFQPISCDDIMLPNKVKKQVKLFESLDDDYACLFGGVIKINKNGEILKNYLNKSSREMFIDRVDIDLAIESDSKKIVSRQALPHAAAYLFKTNIVKIIGQYDENYIWEDYQMIIKLVYNNYKIKYLNIDLIKARVINTSLSRGETRKNDTYNINWMYIDLFLKYSSIFRSDYWTRIKFTRRFNSIFLKDRSLFLKLSTKFVLLQKFPSNLYAALNIFFIYPFAAIFKVNNQIYRLQDRLHKIFNS